MSNDTFNRIDSLIARLERLGKLLLWALLLIITGAVWATRQEMVINDHDRRLREVETVTASNSTDVSEIKGRLHGIASQVGRVPGKVVERMTNE